jgi:hypothetical protein
VAAVLVVLRELALLEALAAVVVTIVVAPMPGVQAQLIKDTLGVQVTQLLVKKLAEAVVVLEQLVKMLRLVLAVLAAMAVLVFRLT